ncbi:MAG: CsbD family protein [Chloroflexota bacterium]
MPDELKGNMKEGLGKLTGNERMEAEGKSEKEMAEAKRKAKGLGSELKGNVKEGVGKLTDNERTEMEGKIEKEKGRIQRQ